MMKIDCIFLISICGTMSLGDASTIFSQGQTHYRVASLKAYSLSKFWASIPLRKQNLQFTEYKSLKGLGII